LETGRARLHRCSSLGFTTSLTSQQSPCMFTDHGRFRSVCNHVTIGIVLLPRSFGKPQHPHEISTRI
jgi:hypothetical protein